MSSPALEKTPAMQQYHRMKAEHPDALVFFRMGDFYELFFDDAVVASRALEIALTSRSKDKDGQPVPMCGVPYHAASGYIARLVRQGFRVALCEQMEDPRTAKGVVKREVVRVITPGDPARGRRARRRRDLLRDGDRARAHEPGGRPGSRPRPASSPSRSGTARAASSACATRSAPPGRASSCCAAASSFPSGSRTRRSPRRRSRAPRSRSAPSSSSAPGASCSPTSASRRSRPSAARRCRGPPPPPGRRCATCARRRSATSPTSPRWSTRTSQDVLAIDSLTRRNLELVESLADGGRRGTLLDVLDHTKTAMGGAGAARLDPAAAGRDGARSRTGSTRSRSWPSAPSTAAGCARPSPASRTSTACSAGSRSARPARATWWRSARSLQALPGGRRGARRVPGPARAPRPEGARPAARPRRRDRAHARSRPAGPAARGRLRPGRRRPGARRAAAHEPRRARDDRGHRGARAGAHRHRLAQGPLQPRLRLLHRGQPLEPRAGAGRLRAQADDRRRRALHHARSSSSTRTRCCAPTSGSRRASALCSRSCASGWPRRRAADPADARAPPPSSTCWPRSPRRRRASTT